MKSILHIGKYYPPFFGGIENFMAELMRIQADSNSIYALVHNHKKSLCIKSEYMEEGKIFRSGLWGRFAFTPICPLFGRDLNKVINEITPDVIHIHMPNLSAFWLLFNSKAKRIPWVVHWHADVLGSEPTRLIKSLYPFYRILERALLKRADKIICTSPNYLDSSLPLAEFKKKCLVIPLGLPQIGQQKPLGNNKAVEYVETSSSQLKILVVGRLSYYKGHLILLRALKQLQSNGVLFQLNIVGQGELLTTIQKEIQLLALKNVKLVGRVSSTQLDDLFEWCDFLCLPSIERTEAFGLVILEAARKSKPALVTAVEGSGMSWVVKNESTGWVVKPNCVDSLSEKLQSIYRKREFCEHYGGAAYLSFLERFSISEVSQKINDVYEQVVPKS